MSDKKFIATVRVADTRTGALYAVAHNGILEVQIPDVFFATSNQTVVSAGQYSQAELFAQCKEIAGEGMLFIPFGTAPSGGAPGGLFDDDYLNILLIRADAIRRAVDVGGDRFEPAARNAMRLYEQHLRLAVIYIREAWAAISRGNDLPGKPAAKPDPEKFKAFMDAALKPAGDQS